MTDKERREDDALKNIIQAAYEFSDDELLADLEEVEATLSDSDFPGIEERMYQRLRERLKKEEAEDVHDLQDEDEMQGAQEPQKSEDPKENTTPTIIPEETEKKVVRFGKRKVVAVGILAAAFVGMLGVTAIGGKNYFFRDVEETIGVVFNNDKNILDISNLEEAYEEIEEKLGIQVLRMGYVPKNVKLLEIECSLNKAIISFQKDEKIIHFVQEVQDKSVSVGVNSDRERLPDVINSKWEVDNIWIEEEVVENGTIGYAIQVVMENARYRIVGQLPKEEMIKIAENLFF